jgi:Phosphotransferase enzyme family
MADAVHAALTAARRAGLPVDDPVVVRDSTNVLVHLSPAPVVARVQLTLSRLRGLPWAETEIAAAQFLAAAGAPVVPPARDVDPGPHVVGGRPITFWRWIDHDSAREDPAAAGRALRELHDAFADFPGALPSCDRLDEVRALVTSDELRAFADRLPPLDGRPIHGDAHLRNVLWSPDGPLWGDLENVCRGPVAFDLASLRFRPSPESEAAIAAYGDAGDVEAALPYVTLFLAAWTPVVADRVGTPEAHAEAQRRVDLALAYARSTTV